MTCQLLAQRPQGRYGKKAVSARENLSDAAADAFGQVEIASPLEMRLLAPPRPTRIIQYTSKQVINRYGMSQTSTGCPLESTTKTVKHHSSDFSNIIDVGSSSSIFLHQESPRLLPFRRYSSQSIALLPRITAAQKCQQRQECHHPPAVPQIGITQVLAIRILAEVL